MTYTVEAPNLLGQFLSSPWLRAFVLFLVTAGLAWRDPRRMRVAVSLGVFTWYVGVLVLSEVALYSERVSAQGEMIYFLTLAGLLLVLLLGGAGFLIWTGVVLVAREGGGFAHYLSLVAGVGLLVYVFALFWAVVRNDAALFMPLFLLIFPVSVLVFGLFSYLQYSALYGWWAKRFARPGSVVLVLGAGLVDGHVSPLLADRLDLGLRMYSKSLVTYPQATFVVSGGKGSDEAVAEGEAMGAYVLGQGFGAGDLAGGELVQEVRSVSTYENLTFSRELVESMGVSGPVDWMVVTSDFHGFRAALLLSKLGMRGNAVGARSRTYFWVSAKLREYIAILNDHRGVTVSLTALAALPLVVYLVNVFVS